MNVRIAYTFTWLVTGPGRYVCADGVACWSRDTDYHGGSFFVRHAYFLGQNDPYSALKTTLKAGDQPAGVGHPAQGHVAAVRGAQRAGGLR